jgi:phosphoglycerate dehydrogenase-like enzyme
MSGGVAVNGGRYGPGMAEGIAAVLPDEKVAPAGTPESVGADVFVSLADDAETLVPMLTEDIRWIHVLGAGVDGFPLEIVGDRMLTCSRGASAPAIAEFVLAAMLAFEKHLPDVWLSSPPERWNEAPLGGLEGRTLGVVGLGAIGSAVASRALAFDMKVVGVRRRERPAIDGVELLPDLESLLAVSDHVVIAAPATAATARLIDDAALAVVKPGVHLVNVARGGLIDQEALLRALDDERVARASLDVVDPEPLPEGHPLYAHPRVRLTPHISWSAPQSVRRTFSLFVENVARFRAGEDLIGHVDREEGY